MESCLAAYDDIVAKILEKCEQLKININMSNRFGVNGTTALEKACIKGSLKCVQLLLKNQSDYSACGAITYACLKKNISILKELIEHEKKNERRQFHKEFWHNVPKQSENVKEYFKLLLDYQVSQNLSNVTYFIFYFYFFY